MPILNAKRLRDYPRLMLFTTWMILGVNLLFHQGWIGAFGQVIAGDFIMFYSTGWIYRINPSMIYDYETQIRTQQALIAPTDLPGYNPYMNPPFAAPLYSLLTYISLNWAVIIWVILAILSVFLSIYLLFKLFSASNTKSNVPYGQLVIIALSFFPFVEGLQAGQNHWITLLLVSGIIFAMFKEKEYLAGALAGLLIYKPQFVLGFIVIWIIWRNFKALVSFGLVAIGWAGFFLLTNGLSLYGTYLRLSTAFMQLPYIAGFPKYLLVTIYGLMTSVIPQAYQPVLSLVSQILFILCALGLAGMAYKFRNAGLVERIPVIVMALILPLLSSPYALLHDMVILIPAYVLCMIYSDSRSLLYTAIIIYLGAFILTFIGALTKIAWISVLVLGLGVAIVVWTLNTSKSSLGKQVIT